MSLVVPPATFTAVENNLTAPAAPFGTSVAAPVATNTKNSTYTQLIASTAADAYGILIVFSDVGGTNAVNSSTLVDIAIGGAGAETVIIPNLNAGYALGMTTTSLGGQKYWFPLYIPAGSRLSATAASAVTVQTVRVSVWLYGKPRRPVWAGSQVVAYGVVGASSKGTDVACGLSGAEGTFTQIVAATTQAHYFLSAGVACAADTTVGGQLNFLDIGVGAATEAVIADNLPFGSNTAEAISMPFPFSIWTEVASGTRLAARISTHAAGAQSYDVILYGVS